MSNSVDAAIYDYFSLLLAEEKEVQPEARPELLHTAPGANGLQQAALAQLLAPVAEMQSQAAVAFPKAETPKAETQKIAVPEEVVPEIVTPQILEPRKVEPENVDDPAPVEQPETGLAAVLEAEASAPITSVYDELDETFQVLFFKVAGLTLAVPLVSLGGIVQIERVNYIMGRPKWFHGVQTHRDSQLNIVNTCAWVMPEKYNDELAESIDYQYIVMLEGSNWGLACESLVNSVKMEKSQVNWRSKAGKRPWLAGIVKQQMCGILNVPALIARLNSGLGSQDPID
ncbi:chemotaxis protein CheW [Shewanella sp. AS1]|uniref:chemotaxis protein CheW n=1 Tax=Shewanella sp. AS1 TaxID=2907626 RepID=UPI001F22BD20|nr:chemotaxis protein CheW [Shewanella sp. AS1]MCE9680041.1 chemotaxis protein CheW [Shewanella sp. AS1]